MTALNKSSKRHLPVDVRVRVKSGRRHNISNNGDPMSCSSVFREKFIRLRSASIEELKAGTAAAFGLSPATEGNDSSDNSTSTSSTNMSFSYLHPSGGKAFLDNDDDVMLALKYWRSCPVLTVSVSWSEATECKSPSPDKVGRLYHEAAENLRDCHGVASITPASLQQTVTLLNVPPRRLVAQGLAPRWKRQHQHPALEAPTDFFEFQDINAAGGREITPETVNDDSDLMSDYEYFSDNEYEGFEGEEDDDSTASAASTSEDIWVHGHGKTKTASTSAERDATMFVTSSFTPLDDNQQPKACRNNANISPATTKVEQDAAAVWGDKASFGLPVPVDHAASDKVTDKTPIHDALLAGGVNVSPQETGALLHALGVDPERLVLLGLIKRELMTPTGTAAPPVKTRGPLGRPTPGHRTIRVSVRLAGSKRGPQTRDGGGDTRKGGVGSRALFGSTSCPQLAVAPLPEMTVRKMRNLVAHGSGFAQRTHERRIGGPASRSYVQVRTCSGHEVRAAFRRRLSSTNLLNL